MDGRKGTEGRDEVEEEEVGLEGINDEGGGGDEEEDEEDGDYRDGADQEGGPPQPVPSCGSRSTGRPYRAEESVG